MRDPHAARDRFPRTYQRAALEAALLALTDRLEHLDLGGRLDLDHLRKVEYGCQQVIATLTPFTHPAVTPINSRVRECPLPQQ